VPSLVHDRYDALLIDLDGVVYRGEEPVPGAAEAIDALRQAGARLVFLTNNSSRTPEHVAEKLSRLGVRAGRSEILTSALATAAMLRSEAEPPRTAYVIGQRGIREALEGIGVRLVDGTAGPVDAVVVGWDSTVDYDRLKTGALLVQRGARLIGTNPDGSYPAPDGLWPGAGALLAAVVATTGVEPTVVGKPAAPMFEAAASVAGAAHPLVVGDRLDTDVSGAAALGWDSMLVLSGASRESDLPSASALPTYVASTIGGLLAPVPAARCRQASGHDVGTAEELVRDAGLPVPDPRPGPGDVLVAEDGEGRLVATASLFPEAGDVVIRSVAVASQVRGKGVGSIVVAAAVQRARALGAARAYVFTETAQLFFSKLGFRAVGREDLPSGIRGSAHAAGSCASAVAMALDLPAQTPSSGRGGGVHPGGYRPPDPKPPPGTSPPAP
jgi:glycerol 3-phosphatase-2